MDKIYKEQNETIIALQKEVDKLKKELQAEREVNVGHRNQNNVISNWLVDYKKEVDELKEKNKLLREQKNKWRELAESYVN